MVEKTCPNCDKIYLADPKRLKFGRQTTCSRKCSYELRGKAKQNNDTHICQVCGVIFARKPFQIKAKFVTVCSHKCYCQARKNGLLPPLPTKPVTEYDCEQCGKHVVIPAALTGARRFRFCSLDCANQWNSGENNWFWRGGNYKAYYGRNWKRQRRRARSRDNYTCQGCGLTEVEYGKQLDVHHIVRFPDFEVPEQANHLNNLISLCHTCHIKREWRDYPDLNTRNKQLHR